MRQHAVEVCRLKCDGCYDATLWRDFGQRPHLMHIASKCGGCEMNFRRDLRQWHHKRQNGQKRRVHDTGKTQHTTQTYGKILRKPPRIAPALAWLSSFAASTRWTRCYENTSMAGTSKNSLCVHRGIRPVRKKVNEHLRDIHTNIHPHHDDHTLKKSLCEHCGMQFVRKKVNEHFRDIHTHIHPHHDAQTHIHSHRDAHNNIYSGEHR